MIAFTNNKIPTPHKKLSPKRQKGKYHPEDKPIKSSISLTNITHLFNLVATLISLSRDLELDHKEKNL